MKSLIIFLVSLIAVSGLAGAVVVDTLSVETCGLDDSPALLEDKVCAKLGKSEFNSLDEEKRIVVNMLTKGDTTPEFLHEFVESWNKMLNFTQDKPEGAATGQNGPIRNIWLATLSVFPSFEEDNTVYTTGLGEVQTGYYYYIDEPKDYDNSGAAGCLASRPAGNPYAYAGAGNCKTEYLEKTDRSKLNVLLNGNSLNSGIKALPLGQNIITPFSVVASNYQFTSELQSYYYIKDEEWLWERGDCCSWKTYKCGEKTCKKCVKYEWDCELDEIKEYPYILKVKHDFQKTIEKYEKPEYSSEVVIFDRKTNPLIQPKIDSPDYKLQLGDASIQFASNYQVDWSYPPYNSLQVVKRNDSGFKLLAEMTQVENEDELTLFSTQPKNAASCSITFFDPLLEKEKADCAVTEKYSPQLKVATGKAIYKAGEKIGLNLSLTRKGKPESGSVELNYCEQSQTINLAGGKGEMDLVAENDCEIITASFADGDFTAKNSAKIAIQKSYTWLIVLAVVSVFIIAGANFAWHYYWRQNI